MADLVVTFDPAAWGAVEPHLRGSAAIAAPAAPARVYPGTGIAIVSGGLDRAAIAKIPGVRVRPARVYRLPKEHRRPPPPVVHSTAIAPGGAWEDTNELSWVLRAIGVQVADEDGAGILVGVVDSGVDAKHPDLTACLAATRTMLPGVPADGDDLGHGTYVVGIIAGARAPAKAGPRYGIAPRARVISYRVYDHHDAASEPAVVDAIHAALDDGCRIVALASGVDGGDAYDPADAQLGELVRSRGAILFAAAGNESNRKLGRIEPTNAPANAPNIYAIGGSNAADGLYNESNGKHDDPALRVDWLACGEDVLSALKGTAGRTVAVSGTSAATAVAAGVAAAVWSRDPNLTAAKVLDQLRARAEIIVGPAAAVGDGRLRTRKD